MGYDFDLELTTMVGKLTILWAHLEDEHYKRNCSAKDIVRKQNLRNLTENTPLYGLANALKRELIFLSGDNVNTAIANLNCRNQDLKDIIYSWLSIDGQVIDTRAVIGVIYRLRCNMFHGEKSIYSLHYQAQLFNSAIDFLTAFVPV